MMSINWKYYKSVGYPSFNDQWELLDVMETMLKANPVGEDGVTNYGTYLNAGSVLGLHESVFQMVWL